MSLRTPKIPSAEHPIDIEPADQRVVVRAGDDVIADTHDALVLREASYPPVFYIPIGDVDETLLRPSETHTYCPFKGDASYKSVDVGDRVIRDALWFYADPYPAVSDIKDHVAFYPDRVDVGAVDGEREP